MQIILVVSVLGLCYHLSINRHLCKTVKHQDKGQGTAFDCKVFHLTNPLQPRRLWFLQVWRLLMMAPSCSVRQCASTLDTWWHSSLMATA